MHSSHGPLARYVKLWVAHAPGMPGTFSPPPIVSDPDMHHATCVTHVPLCIPGSLTSGFLWSRRRGIRSRHSRHMCNPQFYVSGKRSMYHAVLALWGKILAVDGYRACRSLTKPNWLQPTYNYVWDGHRVGGIWLCSAGSMSLWGVSPYSRSTLLQKELYGSRLVVATSTPGGHFFPAGAKSLILPLQPHVTIAQYRDILRRHLCHLQGSISGIMFYTKR